MSLTLYKAGQEPSIIEIGDFLLIDTERMVSPFIRAAQKIRFRGDYKRYARWNHSAVCYDQNSIVEALVKGVQMSPLSKYEDRDYYLVHFDFSEEDRTEIKSFIDSTLSTHTDYGWLDVLSAGLSLIFGSKLIFRESGTAICSELVAEALLRAGYVFKKDPALMTPADLAAYFNVP